MTPSLVADTSFLFKIAFPNPHADAAEAVCKSYTLFAPAFVQIELANALWKAVEFGGLAEAKAHRAYEQITLLYRPVPDEDLVINAMSLAVKISHPVYDCVFATLASDMSAPLITADRKLIKALARDLPDFVCLDIMNLPEGFL